MNIRHKGLLIGIAAHAVVFCVPVILFTILSRGCVGWGLWLTSAWLLKTIYRPLYPIMLPIAEYLYRHVPNDVIWGSLILFILAGAVLGGLGWLIGFCVERVKRSRKRDAIPSPQR